MDAYVWLFFSQCMFKIMGAYMLCGTPTPGFLLDFWTKENKQMGAVVWCPGRRLQDPLILVAWVSPTWKSWHGHYKCGGTGTKKNQNWSSLDWSWASAHPNTLALFAIAMTTQVGNGTNTLFWTDCWVHGNTITKLAPLVVAHVPARIRQSRTVAEALQH